MLDMENKKVIYIAFMITFLLIIAFTHHFECKSLFGQRSRNMYIVSDMNKFDKLSQFVLALQDRIAFYEIYNDKYPDRPSNFIANTIVNGCSYKINLQWTKSYNNKCTTYIEWSTYPIQNIGEGYFLYNGHAKSFDHENILANTQYHYSAWSWSELSNRYSLVVTTSAFTPYDPEMYWIWPGHDDVTEVDDPSFSGDNPSGITYQPKEYVNDGQGINPSGIGGKGTMWCVRNNPSKIYKLVYDESLQQWKNHQNDGWQYGKYLSEGPDAEGITMSEWNDDYIYVCTEKNGGRYTIRRYPITTTADYLYHTHKWQLDNLGDSSNPNKVPYGNTNNGFEALTWIPDNFLEENGFWDENRDEPYDRLNYPDHGTGLFFVGLEHNGKIYAYALSHLDIDNFTKIATIDSKEDQIMGLEFDRETGLLWANSDNSNWNKIRVLEVDETGHFVVTQKYYKPSTLSNINNEGIAFFPEAESINGYKNFFWIDDNDSGGHSLRMDDIPCGPKIDHQ